MSLHSAPLAAGTTTSSTRAAPRAATVIAVGALGGFTLGVLARAWMRLISEDPEFTWAGTMFIVIGFTLFGLAQSVVAVARRANLEPWKLTIMRMIGGFFTLPLFMAAGMVMFPTVVGWGLAAARHGWYTAVRVLLALVGAVPVAFVGHDLVDSFGWSLQTAAGFVAMLAIYAVIVWATRFVMAPQHDGPR